MLPKWHILRECKAKEIIQETILTKGDRKDGLHIYISCMYVDELHSGQVTVRYISAHTGHEFRSTRSSPPQKCEISMKMSMGVPAERVLQAGINQRGGEEEASLYHDVRCH